jgi:hypothetical protein
MSAMKEHFGMIARCLGCTEDNWDQTVDTLDQFASGRATLVFVRCWCGGGDSASYKVLLAYRRSVFVSHRDVTRNLCGETDETPFAESAFDRRHGTIRIFGAEDRDRQRFVIGRLKRHFKADPVVTFH